MSSHRWLATELFVSSCTHSGIFYHDLSSAIFSLLQHFQYFILLASFIAHNAHCNWCHQYSLWQESSIDRSKLTTEQRISYKRTAFSRFFAYSFSVELRSALLHQGLRIVLKVQVPHNCPRAPKDLARELRTRNWAAMRGNLPVSGGEKKWLLQEGSKSPVSVINSWWNQLPVFSIDNAHLIYNAHPKHFRHSFWCVDNAHGAN
jgi:hypothetical protein